MPVANNCSIKWAINRVERREFGGRSDIYALDKSEFVCSGVSIAFACQSAIYLSSSRRVISQARRYQTARQKSLSHDHKSSAERRRQSYAFCASITSLLRRAVSTVSMLNCANSSCGQSFIASLPSDAAASQLDGPIRLLFYRRRRRASLTFFADIELFRCE